MERVTITATFDLSDGACKWRNPAETAEDFRRMVFDDLIDYNIDNVKVTASHAVITKEDIDDIGGG